MNQAIQPTQPFHRGGDQAAALLGLREIRGQGFRASSEPPRLLGQLLGRSSRRPIVNGQVRSGSRERQCDLASDPNGGSGDKRNSTGKRRFGHAPS